ncbi:MAG: DNA-3-methyladenine glycosylase [Gammaproteobacteria bacterium]|nr:DNA-3-methyladenine glycosylase [Gammaproteobacteria bacterium]
MNRLITPEFFHQEPQALAIALLGKVLRRKVQWQGKTLWLSARIIETEAYYRDEKASHSSLGYTAKRKAMFMTPGTIYMYYARGSDSLNFSAQGAGNAVLVKAAYPHFDSISGKRQLEVMRALNPGNSISKTTGSENKAPRAIDRLCNGQTLLCKSLDLKVVDWDQQTLDEHRFYLGESGYQIARYIQCPRLGIPVGRDENLWYRFIDFDAAHQATSNPLTKRKWREGVNYRVCHSV